ncbi:MAG: acylneuraminate cytidylyltransferase family protein [Alphaproteobacteria bacterium]|nr:acylneuraminate cytidylyltransferase family protein [Alphaproteobacteria bacterium]
MTQAVTALISMKGHSSRVPGKNIRPLAGKPCCYWILKALSDADRISDISVETDDDGIEQTVRSLFPEMRILRRPDSLKGDFVSMNPLIEHQIAHSQADIFLQTHSTNPLLKADTIDRAVAAYFEPGAHDSLFSVTKLQPRLYWPDGRPINHDPAELLPTQHLPPVYEENSCIYIFTREGFAKRKHRVGEAPKLFETPHLESVDIDEEHDFAFCEYLMERRLAEDPQAAS